MKKVLYLLCMSLFALAVSCKKETTMTCGFEEEATEGVSTADSNYLIFGHYYGFCWGHECIEIFKLEEDRVLEDTLDKYPGAANFYTGIYYELSADAFEASKDLVGAFPDSLLLESETVIGMPDATDGGGLYIEYNFNGIHKFWLIDQFQFNVPEYLHPFMDEVNAVIEEIQ